MTTNRRRAASAVALATLLVSSGIARAEPARDAMKRIHQKWTSAVASGDAKSVAACYAMKATLMPPGAPQVEGREAIQQFFASKGPMELAVDTGPNGESGGLAWCTGLWTLRDKTGAILDRGKYVEVWTETDGGWKIFKDIWNSDGSIVKKP